MDGSSPPVNSGGARDSNPGTPSNPNAAEHLTDRSVFRNHRIVRVRYALAHWQWQELRWIAETSRFYAEWRATS
jgi:hypothetical protein